jgi:hypothetical protein
MLPADQPVTLICIKDACPLDRDIWWTPAGRRRKPWQEQIEEMAEKLRQSTAGDELDREMARLHHHKSVYSSLVPTTAF